MAKENAKTIDVKCLMSPDFYFKFAQACDGESHSSVLRRLAKDWLKTLEEPTCSESGVPAPARSVSENFTRRRVNDAPTVRHRERPKTGHIPAMFFPGRAVVNRVVHQRL